MNTSARFHLSDERLATLERQFLDRITRAMPETDNDRMDVAWKVAHATIVRELCAAMASVRAMRTASGDGVASLRPESEPQGDPR